MKLDKQDFVIGAIDRIAVRRGLSPEVVENLLVDRAGLTPRAASCLSAHWFSTQFKHGGIEFRRAEYLQRQTPNS
jgi:hypothetical protein